MFKIFIFIALLQSAGNPKLVDYRIEGDRYHVFIEQCGHEFSHNLTKAQFNRFTVKHVCSWKVCALKGRNFLNYKSACLCKPLSLCDKFDQFHIIYPSHSYQQLVTLCEQ